ncbi:NAD(P)H-binding protein [Fructobacillus sp. M1-13]|uniref:NAD(P)H-binding protein n=1 Tax=Fructobacillus papyriferae TaxID=2713171 RepID=A0ABS5QNI9_9LACO|nr:NAD(P)H-binding protein [Fructobacillus papyriferae]MBS9334684.1 NAD(P)H-binding protein [Fructobacillus papyriferae]MCD2158674.1 NAD(P)H-binding protein [Fructobacillus papyriferae]
MKNIAIIGANGQIARLVESHYINHEEIQLRLLARKITRLPETIKNAENVDLIDGDANSYEDVKKTIQETDIVYLNLGGVFTPMVRNILQVMDDLNVSRLIHVTGLGLYHEVPEPFESWLEESVGHSVMEDTRVAADLIEQNQTINATIIRAAYMSNADKVSYELTTRHEPYKGTTISRASIADLIEQIIDDPTRYQHESLGIAEPGTDGPYPIYKD